MTRAGSTRDSATVMLVRDGDRRERPLEVFMVRRHPSTAFGSVHVFPGGVVDPGDHSSELDERCPGLTDADASAVLEVPGGGRAFWVAAIREAFEEAGVLLAQGPDGRPVRFDGDRAAQARYDEHRRSLRAGTATLPGVLAEEGLVLAADQLRYLSRWITPVGEPKRFDTRFFLARAPEGQAYAHDDEELIGSEWVRPSDALARHRAGDFAMIGPTIHTLEHLGAFATSDELLAAHDVAPGRLDPRSA
jgi:8-oxo-dGTP pyrophosphatase MutT (NUDIX family)